MAAFGIVALFVVLNPKKKKTTRHFLCYFINSSHQLCKGWVVILCFTKKETEAQGDKGLLQTPQLIQDSEDMCFSAHLNTSRCPEDTLFHPLPSPHIPSGTLLVKITTGAHSFLLALLLQTPPWAQLWVDVSVGVPSTAGILRHCLHHQALLYLKRPILSF